MGLTRALELMGGRFKGAGVGYGWHEYTLPNGDLVCVNHREEWRYMDQGGIGSDSLWSLAWPRVCSWREESEAKEKAVRDARYAKAVALLEQITAHLNAIDWAMDGKSMTLYFGSIGPYPTASIADGPQRRAEVWVEFHDDGSIRTASVGSVHCSGIPSIKKQAAKYYEFK
jgi:hypothetical protein